VSTQHINYNQADIPRLLQLNISQILMYYLFEVIFMYLISVSLLSLQIFAIKFSHVVLKHEDCRKTKTLLEVCFGWKFSV